MMQLVSAVEWRQREPLGSVLGSRHALILPRCFVVNCEDFTQKQPILGVGLDECGGEIVDEDQSWDGQALLNSSILCPDVVMEKKSMMTKAGNCAKF
jgi:hypothetical protein